LRKEDADALLRRDVERLEELQDKLFAQKTYALQIGACVLLRNVASC
jgi:hypothetical protein